MDQTTHWVVIGVGAIAIIGGMASYWRNTERWMAPVVFAAVGAVLLGVSSVKMNFTPEGGSVEIGPVVAASKTNADAAQKNADAIAAMGQRFDSLQTAIDDLKTQVNTRMAAQAGPPAPPIVLRNLEALTLSRPQFNAQLNASTNASAKAVETSAKLQLRDRALAVPKP
jgi:hypothetical protein